MNLNEIIDRYVDLLIEKSNVDSQIVDHTNGMRYAEVEGDLRFADNDYEAEAMYNNSHRNHMEKKAAAEQRSMELEQMLYAIEGTYKEVTSQMSEQEMVANVGALSQILEGLQSQASKLEQRHQWAETKGQEAFDNNNLEDEQEFNRISYEAYRDLEINNAKQKYYDMFFKRLKEQSAAKINDGDGSMTK